MTGTGEVAFTAQVASAAEAAAYPDGRPGWAQLAQLGPEYVAVGSQQLRVPGESGAADRVVDVVDFSALCPEIEVPGPNGTVRVNPVDLTFAGLARAERNCQGKPADDPLHAQYAQLLARARSQFGYYWQKYGPQAS